MLVTVTSVLSGVTRTMDLPVVPVACADTKGNLSADVLHNGYHTR